MNRFFAGWSAIVKSRCEWFRKIQKSLRTAWRDSAVAGSHFGEAAMLNRCTSKKEPLIKGLGFFGHVMHDVWFLSIMEHC